MNSVYIPLLALGAALCFSSGQICSRLGLKYGTPTSATSFSLFTSTVILFVALGPFVSWEQTPPVGLLLFIGAGVLSPFCTQILLFVSATKVGISRASPLRNTTPLFAGLMAVLVLGETVTAAIATGTLLIIIGASLLGMKDSEAAAPYQPIYLLLPIMAAFLGGFSSPMRKLGYTMIDSVPLAIWMVQGGGFAALLVYLVVTGKYRELVFRRETLWWFGLSGVLNSVAVSLNMTALEMGDVVLVSPLIATTPLFTVILSTVFLRSLERVTLKVLVGAASICLGGIVLTTF